MSFEDFKMSVSFDKSGAVNVSMNILSGISTRKLELIHQAIDREYLRKKGEVLRKARVAERKQRQSVAE